MLPGVIRFLSLRPWTEAYLALALVPKPVQTREAVPGEAVSVDSTSFRLALSDFGFLCRHCRGGGGIWAGAGVPAWLLSWQEMWPVCCY